MKSIYKYASNEEGGRAQLKDLNASYKDLTQLCRAIRKQPVAKAKKIIDGVITMKMPVEYRSFNKGIGHKKQLGGKQGRFPKKEAKMLLTALQNAESNAKQLGLDATKLVVKSAIAYKQNSMKRYRKYWASGITLGYGKQSIFSNYVTARLEIIVGVQ